MATLVERDQGRQHQYLRVHRAFLPLYSAGQVDRALPLLDRPQSLSDQVDVREQRPRRTNLYNVIIFAFLILCVHGVCNVMYMLSSWPDEAPQMMMWQTSLLCRAGLVWIAILVSRLSLLLHKWPAWLFGICFLIWMDAGGNVLREVIVRNGVVGYKEDEKPGRMTLLYEGSTLAKMLLLVLIVYTYYITPWIEESSELRLLFSVGFFVSMALATLPLVRSRRYEIVTCTGSSCLLRWI